MPGPVITMTDERQCAHLRTQGTDLLVVHVPDAHAIGDVAQAITRQIEEGLAFELASVSYMARRVKFRKDVRKLTHRSGVDVPPMRGHFVAQC